MTTPDCTPMSDAELAECLNILLECERAGVKVLGEYEKDFADEADARTLIVESRHDEGRYCRLMFGYLQELGADISRATGGFADKARAVPGRAEPRSGLGRTRDRACTARALSPHARRPARDARHAPRQHRQMRHADRHAGLSHRRKSSSRAR